MVFKQIPKRERPHCDRPGLATSHLVPILEHLLKLPASGPAVGTPEWIEAMKKTPQVVTFANLVKYPTLMRAHVKDCIQRGDEDGLVIMEEGEKILEDFYSFEKNKSEPILPETRRYLKYHPSFEPLRAGAVFYAIKKLREFGFIPMCMRRETLPPHARSKGWCNFAKIKHLFSTFYCYAQGLSRTSDKVREVEVYICHGMGVLKKQNVPTIRILHKRIQTGMHRFSKVAKIEECFSDLLQMIKDQPRLVKYLDDGGLAKAPTKYLVAVEVGLRGFGKIPAAMGKFAMDSFKEWTSDNLKGAKREAYIAMCRHVKSLGSYDK